MVDPLKEALAGVVIPDVTTDPLTGVDLSGVDLSIAATANPTPADEPGIIGSSVDFALDTAEDFVRATLFGLPGLVLEAPVLAARGINEALHPSSPFHPSILAAMGKLFGKELRVPTEHIPNQEVGSYLLGAATAAYDDVLDSQSDLALAQSRATGLPLEVTSAGTSVAFTGAQFISPGKYLRMIMGILPKAAATVYGASKLTKLGLEKLGTFKGATEVAKRAASVGDMVDPLRSLTHADEAVGEAARLAQEAGPDVVAIRARQAALFPDAPQATSLPGVVVTRDKSPVSRTAISYLDSLEAGDVKGALGKIKSSEQSAVRRSAKLTDDVLKKVEDERAAAYREVGASVEDAAKAGRLENSVLPTDVPELIITDPVEAAQNLGRQYIYRREHGRFVSSEREILFKKALSSGDEKADKALLEDLSFWNDGTGNPTVSLIDTEDDVLRRIRAHPRGEAALGLAESVRPFMDNLFDEMKDINIKVGDKQISYIENYLHQAWKPPRVGGVGGKGGLGGSRGLLDSGLFRGRENFGQAKGRIKGRFEETRTLPNLHTGITKAGLEPRTMDFAERIHQTERQYGEVMALKKFLGDLSDLNAMPDGSPAFLRVKGKMPKGVAEADYIKADIPYVGRSLAGEGDMLIHKEVYKPVRNLIEGIAKNEGSWIDDISVLNKRANFAFTMFHGYSLAENSILSLGLGKGSKTLGGVVKAGGGLPFMQRLGGPRALDHLTLTDSMRESTIRGLKYNLTVETPRTDLMRNVWERASKEASDRLAKGGLFKKGASKALKSITWAQKNFDTALWERMHAPLKVTVFDELFETVLRSKRAGGKGLSFKTGGLAGKFKGKELAKLSDDEIGYRVAAFVNDEFGGQAWETLQGKIMGAIARPKNLQALRRYTISPDWNTSSFRANLAMLSLVGGDPVRGVLGARHWRNSLFGLAAASHALNYMTTAAFEGEGRLAFDNDPGKDGMFGGILPTHIATGTKKDGRRVYVRVGKQLQEVPEFIESPTEFVGRKMIPWAQTLVNTVAKEKDPFSFVGQAVQQAREEGIELDGVDMFLLHGADMAEAFSPFGSTFNPLQKAPPLGRGSDLLLPLPQSLGGSRGDLQRRMQKAMTEKDDAEMERINQSLLDNGYSAKDITAIFNTAQTLSFRQEAN